MKTFASRLRDRREALKLSQPQLAAEVRRREGSSFSQQTLSHLETGRVAKTSSLHTLAEILHCSPEWLRTGKGECAEPSEMGIPLGNALVATWQAEPRTLRLAYAHPDGISSKLQRGLVREIDAYAGLGGGGVAQFVKAGDVLSEQTLAEWRMPTEFLETELRLRPGLCEIIRVKGDSMEPVLRDGDRVIVDRNDRAMRQGGIFALRDGDELIIKQVELVRGAEPPRVVCSSVNPRYSPFELVLGADAEVIGRVAAHIGRM